MGGGGSFSQSKDSQQLEKKRNVGVGYCEVNGYTVFLSASRDYFMQTTRAPIINAYVRAIKTRIATENSHKGQYKKKLGWLRILETIGLLCLGS